jgi:hypothetical protein
MGWPNDDKQIFPKSDSKRKQKKAFVPSLNNNLKNA